MVAADWVAVGSHGDWLGWHRVGRAGLRWEELLDCGGRKRIGVVNLGDKIMSFSYLAALVMWFIPVINTTQPLQWDVLSV